MIKRGIVAVALVAAVAALARWNDRAHLVAVALAFLVLAAFLLAVSLARRRRSTELDPLFDEEAEDQNQGNLLRDALGGVIAGGVAVALAAFIFGYVLPPFYPWLVGSCAQIEPRLAIYEETAAWPRAVALIDARLSRPIDTACYQRLAEQKCRYLIEWSKALPPEEADVKLQEAVDWANSRHLEQYGTIAALMRENNRPTPTPAAPQMVTPTPSPTPTPRPLPVGSTLHVSGIDTAFFPPTLFVYLRVLDGSGKPITDLTASDVHVSEDGRPVHDVSLASFSQAPAPICAALVLDYSGSMEGAPIDAAKAGARAFLSLLAPADQVEVIGFNDQARVLQARTTDHAAAAAALDQMEAKDWTALWDALYLAADGLAGCPGRKVIVVLTDGADNRSQHTAAQFVAQAQRAGLSIYVIGLRTPEYNGAALQPLVSEVGGHYAEATSTAELEQYYRTVAGAIRSEYRLALSLGRLPDGGKHRLRIEVGGPQPLVAEPAYQDPDS